jgi:hypothetical protein
MRPQGPIVAALYMKDPAQDALKVQRLEKLVKVTGRNNYCFYLVYAYVYINIYTLYMYMYTHTHTHTHTQYI